MDAPEDRSKALNEHISSGFAPRADIVAACRHVCFVPNLDITPSPKQARPAKNRDGKYVDGALCVMRHVDGVSTKSCCHRPTNPARAEPRHGATQKSQSWPIYAPP